MIVVNPSLRMNLEDILRQPWCQGLREMPTPLPDWIAKHQQELDEDDKKKSEDALKKEYKAIAERRVRLGLLLAQIADENKVQVSKEDMQNALVAEAHRYPGQEQQVFEYYTKNPRAMEALRAPVFEEKIVDFLLGKVKVTEKAVTVADLYAFDPDKKAKK